MKKKEKELLEKEIEAAKWEIVYYKGRIDEVKINFLKSELYLKYLTEKL